MQNLGRLALTRGPETGFREVVLKEAPSLRARRAVIKKGGRSTPPDKLERL
jgi:hypothetical protein